LKRLPARGASFAEAPGRVHVRELSLTRDELLICEQARDQYSKFLAKQGRRAQEAGEQALELTFGHRVEVDATKALLGTRALKPTKEDLCGAVISDCALTQTTFDLRVARRRALSARGTALAAQPCGFARLLRRPPMTSSSTRMSLTLSGCVSFVELGR
jgi:hypothetical protein